MGRDPFACGHLWGQLFDQSEQLLHAQIGIPIARRVPSGQLVCGGPGQLDRIEVELSESPAAPANDTPAGSGEHLLSSGASP